MRLQTAPKNEAILKNVGEIGEFRIKNSAKAFQILSSGLYQNKVRAIIRELSCNAVDSHVAAGKANVPFTVHLPNMLEPWFSVRDYGIGLTHDEVTKIYTTYFESTKTESDAFIGALGLGSKSPFSYTDNFTVIAVKDRHRGIYSAFINDQGVPSIVLMSEGKTAEANGVEVKFSVEDQYDFAKFSQEAAETFKYFKLLPTIEAGSHFSFKTINYIDKDIVPGVNTFKPDDCSQESVAIMGNIGYPIQLPNAEKTLSNDLRNLLNCNLELRFEIGELDFAASREGLSYIPHTVNNIAAKLQALHDNLYSKLCAEVKAISNYWDRHNYLKTKFEQKLWTHMVAKYVTEKKHKMNTLGMHNYGHYLATTPIELRVDTLKKKFNIEIHCLGKWSSEKSFTTFSDVARTEKEKDAKGNAVHYRVREFQIISSISFIIDDIQRGVISRVKNHWLNHKDLPQSIWILSPADKKKPMDTVGFFKKIYNPPESMKLVASALDIKERKKIQKKDAVVLRLEERGGDNYRTRTDLVWREHQKLSKYDPAVTYYYCKMSGLKIVSDYDEAVNARDLVNRIRSSGIHSLNTIKTIYGIRKSDLPEVKTMKNWVAIEDFIHNTLVNFSSQDFRGLLRNVVDSQYELKYTMQVFKAITNRKSPYVQFFEQMDQNRLHAYNATRLQELCSTYAKDSKNNPLVMLEEAASAMKKLIKRYPLMAHLNHVPDNKLAEYIDLIDTIQGV